MEYIQKLDRELFLWINDTMTHWALDATMPILTDLHKEPLFLYGMAPMMMAVWIYKQKVFALRVLVGLVICIAITDNINSRVLKPIFERPRPSVSILGVNVRARHNSGYSFPSTHAANNFAGAVFLSLVYPASGTLFFFIAFLVAFSRIYVGVHYPLDVLFGALWAGLFARECFRIWRHWIPSKLPKYDVHLD